MNGTRDEAGRQRVVIERVTPEIDGGRFPIERVIGEKVVVEADAYADGNDAVTCRLLYRHDGAAVWSGVAMQA
jgi:starch synthase (maltosyl-transferring)